ncbi:hypothetical protein HTV80_32240 [Streptomyces sp. Vc74B-19]|uniref:hypothetical protein n=1 Tax=unclassified Streptomyces TaxID=2593676 RepID=UPI001BFC887E|nr:MULTISPECIES: hypothetical protein [unclassified Streptomyces]MBT3167726.1 hypothetical protein [Streptomyces sp. Vc74B-19]MCO4699397.1 hypothetical protein [Streptomyces sp. RO-S4]
MSAREPQTGTGTSGRDREGLLRRLVRPRRSGPAGGPPEPVDRLRLEHELAVSRLRLARWQQYADAYERRLGDAERERAHLLAWLAALHPASSVLTPLTGPDQEGAHRLCLVAGGWHLSWRIPPGDLALFAHVPFRAESAAAHPVPDLHDQGALIRRHVRLLAMEGVVQAGLAGTPGGTPPAPPGGP